VNWRITALDIAHESWLATTTVLVVPVASSPPPETEQPVVTAARTVTPAAPAAASLRDVRMDVSPSAEEGTAGAVEMLDFLRRC
jgi:hypothetical protein